MSPDSIAVAADKLTRTYGQFVAVDRIDLAVGAGEIFGFLGPNGAGKSTTIRMLCGILAPTSGSARVGGYDVVREPGRVRRIIGYMSQKFSLYEDLRLEENIEFFGGVQDLDADRLRRRKLWALETGRLGEYRREFTRNLPGGVRQRLALACATIHEPPILFLDEPTAGVDPRSRRDFWDLIHSLSGGGVTIIVTTHYMDEAEHCDRLALMHRGRLVAVGTPRDLKEMSRQSPVLEIETGDLPAMMDLASEMPGVLEIGLYGNRLHAVVRATDSTRRALLDAAAARNIHVGAIRSITPSLEDAFVSLLED
ncbi:MAG: ABC transporter ATP-binding protein [Acidobacteria bacterium]|nr:ABC transporter ATP-binding protein [Acidobacteriota bacterium]